jgi:glutamate synthase domain-containing protein 3
VNVNLETLLISAPGISSRPLVTSSPLVGADLSRLAPIDRPLAPHGLAEQLLLEAQPALRGESSVLTQHSIHNDDRTIGANLAGEIARRYGDAGLPGVSITSIFRGSAGQSFGAFCMSGMYMVLHGEANDYVGKSMRGGQIIIAPPIQASFAAHKNTIIGNTVLYGATGGLLFAAGRAGERFAVRNSGALAVVEGVGAHACEYMTGGLVVILGETGQNFAAGMTAGAAYVLDTDGMFPARCNTELVDLHRISDPDEIEALRTIIQWHHKKTRSWRASQLLSEWSRMHRIFWRVSPSSASDQEQGISSTARDYVDAHTHNIELIGAAHL